MRMYAAGVVRRKVVEQDVRGAPYPNRAGFEAEDCILGGAASDARSSAFSALRVRVESRAGSREQSVKEKSRIM